jgi:hypothetical protein
VQKTRKIGTVFDEEAAAIPIQAGADPSQRRAGRDMNLDTAGRSYGMRALLQFPPQDGSRGTSEEAGFGTPSHVDRHVS